VPTPRGFRVSVACAGHPLAVLARADGRVETVGRPGRMLGPFPEVHAEDVTAGLRPGDALVLYTDGVVESRRDDELFGEERLQRTVAAERVTSADELAGRIERAVTDFQRGPPRDDLAVLVLRALPPA
jgi:sigma-B regulation protein RsbU (phosphoserine phosphatase)